MEPLSGRHVRLEPLTHVHVDGLVEAATEDRGSYVFTWVPTDHDSAVRYVDQALAEQAAGTSRPFATVAQRDGSVLGSTRYLNVRCWEWEQADGNPDVVEIGATWLRASAQRTPVNTEAKLLQLTHAFDTWHVQRVELKTDARNERSRQAIERLGAQLEGVLRSYQPSAEGPWPRDTAMYSILASEWPAVRAGLLSRLDDPAG